MNHMTISGCGFEEYAPEDWEEQELMERYREDAEERDYEAHRCSD